MPILTGHQRAAVIFRERLLATLLGGAGRQATPYRNSCCQIAITMIRLEKERPLTPQESETFAQSIRGLRVTLDGSNPPLMVRRRDDRTAVQRANDEGIRAAYSDTSRRPSWDLQTANRSGVVDTMPVDPELQARGWGKGWEGRPMADCPIQPTSGAIVNLNRERENFPIIWSDGAPRGLVSKFVRWALNAQNSH